MRFQCYVIVGMLTRCIRADDTFAPCQVKRDRILLMYMDGRIKLIVGLLPLGMVIICIFHKHKL